MGRWMREGWPLERIEAVVVVWGGEGEGAKKETFVF